MKSPPPKRRSAESSWSESPNGAAGVSDFTQLALWMAASLAGLVTAVLLARRPFFESLARRMGWSAGGPAIPRPDREQGLCLLADAIVGNTKAAVAAVFGPPRSAVAAGLQAPAPTFWDADTWYYPLPKGERLAVAIAFEEDFATSVEFLHPPR